MKATAREGRWQAQITGMPGASFSSRFLDEASLPDAFAPGTRVHHAVFGDGTVLEVDPVQKAQLIQFDSMPTPRAISMRAKLERL